MDKHLLKERVIVKLFGKRIEKVIAGGSNGSIIILQTENELSLSIKCVWRLEDKNMVIAGWNESNDSLTGNLTKQVKALMNEVIKDVEINDFFDIKIHFLNGKTINVFCDVTPNYEPDYYDENWIICDKQLNQCYSVNKNFEIVITTYK